MAFCIPLFNDARVSLSLTSDPPLFPPPPLFFSAYLRRCNSKSNSIRKGKEKSEEVKLFCLFVFKLVCAFFFFLLPFFFQR